MITQKVVDVHEIFGRSKHFKEILSNR